MATERYAPPRNLSHSAKAAAPPEIVPSVLTHNASRWARSAVVPSAARSVNCHGISKIFRSGGRLSRLANQCALEVQKAQSPS
jgi:hypothetical protein